MAASQQSQAGIPYLGSRISLISKAQIRYDGILYTIDPNESTVALAKVRSYGTEDRPTDRPVPPREEIYEYIIFRGSDIKDIHVCEPPKPQGPFPHASLPHDPAIVKSSQPAQPTFAPSGLTAAASGASNATSPLQSRDKSEYAPPIPSSPQQPPQVQSPAVKFFKPTLDQGVQVSMRVPFKVSSSGHHGGKYTERDQRMKTDDSQRRGGHPNRGRGGNNMRGFSGVRGQVYRQQSGPRGRGGSSAGRGGRDSRERSKFDSDFDFDEANAKFSKEELEEEIKKKLTITDGEKETKEEEGKETEESVYYDKKKSFFDNLCDDTGEDKERPNWREERKLNSETFGVSSVRRGRGGGFRPGSGNFRGGRGYRGRGGGRGSYNNFRGTGNGNNGGFRQSRRGWVDYEYDIPEKPSTKNPSSN
ncbi:DgyrCDS14287 [Dimorphilus gyrociliatus]|uniref:DgyrCDS14287 n=1 Tax=Dimorphilus gyrociliatus TaxID=2664684 RepID=A0A7I8WDC9_9ANNE|nr:DgyrCDS14287 [Dimorphilus gyrociliatus]